MRCRLRGLSDHRCPGWRPMIRERVIPIASLVVALFIPISAVAIQNAHADPCSDMGYLTVLDREGIPYTSATVAIAGGHAICERLLAGLPRRDVVAAVASAANKLPLSLAGVLVDASQEAYCPETMTRVGGRLT